MLQAGVLAWLLPGAGHWWLGYRRLAVVYFVAISFAYLSGVAIGGAKNLVNPQVNRWLFLAELGVGGYTTGFFLLSRSLPTLPVTEPSPYVSYYPEAEVAQIYLAVAGLLNVLAVCDALARGQNAAGLSVFHHESIAARQAARESSEGTA